MGHFHCENFSRTVNRVLTTRASATIKECVEELKRTKQKFHASEGAYGPDHEDYQEMLSKGVEQVIHCLYEHHMIDPEGLTRKQKKVFQQWVEDDIGDWDAGDDGKGGEYGVFDTIRWKAAKRRLPVFKEITN